MDNQKVRSSLSGILYAFEIPLPSTVDNTPPSIDVVTSGEATSNVRTEEDAPTKEPASGNEVNAFERSTTTEEPCEVPSVTNELARSPSRSSSERSYGGTLKLPCLSRQTSDDEEDDCIEVGSEVSGKSNMGILKQFSPGFMRKLSSKKSLNVWNTRDSLNTTEERGQSAVSCNNSTVSIAKSTPGHSQNTSVSSTSGSAVHGETQFNRKPCGYLIGVHRKLVNMPCF